MSQLCPRMRAGRWYWCEGLTLQNNTNSPRNVTMRMWPPGVHIFSNSILSDFSYWFIYRKYVQILHFTVRNFCSLYLPCLKMFQIKMIGLYRNELYIFCHLRVFCTMIAPPPLSQLKFDLNFTNQINLKCRTPQKYACNRNTLHSL
jgi:hypothetical protein